MKCMVCGNTEENTPLSIKEMHHCLKESFSYFQCPVCRCIQIETIPENLSRYYPADYYSFNGSESNDFIAGEPGFFKRVQSDYLIYGKRKLLGKIFTLGYKPNAAFRWLRNLGLKRDAHILDIGSGNGRILHSFYRMGFKNLTGVDPYIKKDFDFSDSFHIYKKDLLALDETQKFDCIMMHHSFEHMEFEKEVLIKVKRLLSPGGKLLIRIPVFSEPLFKKYDVHLVSLDAPRHLYIHSVASIKQMCDKAGLKIDMVEHDADESSFWASEQYLKGICLNAENSYAISRKQSVFTKEDINVFKKDIRVLNRQGVSDTAAFYIS